MKATLNQYRQSARKVRLAADMIRGMDANAALLELTFLPKRAGVALEKLLRSAISNAVTNDGKDRDSLYVKEIRVNEGLTLRRMMPRARGRGMPIRKRTSHISIVLGERTEKPEPQKKAKKAPKKSEAAAKKEKESAE